MGVITPTPPGGLTPTSPFLTLVDPDEPAPKKPNGKPTLADVDTVISYFNEVACTKHPTGSRRNKALAPMILGRLKEQSDEGPALALRRAKAVIDEKFAQTTEQNGGGKPRFEPDWFRLSTLFGASKFPEYLEEARRAHDKERHHA